MSTAAEAKRETPARWPSLHERRVVGEWMDDPALDATMHRTALAGLERINRISFVGPQFWRLVRPIAMERRRTGQALRIVDLACGGGELLTAMGARCRRSGIQAELTAWDASVTALRQAQDNAERAGLELRTVQSNLLKDDMRSGADRWDVVTCSLFVHHLVERADIVAVLQRAADLAQRRLIVGDLRRTRLGHVMAAWGSRVLSRSPVVHFDAPASVEAALTMAELRECADAAGLEGAKVHRAWPQRMMLVWDRPEDGDARETRAGDG